MEYKHVKREFYGARRQNQTEQKNFKQGRGGLPAQKKKPKKKTT